MKPKVGSLVKWIGFPGATLPPDLTGPSEYGIVVKLWKDHSGNTRADVHWGDGRYGYLLYINTIEVVSDGV